MKKTLKLALLFLSLMLTPIVWSCSDDDDDVYEKIISYDKLPSQAKSFITEFFPDAKVAKTQEDYDNGVKVYEVYFTNGYDATFSTTGEWVEVDAPEGLSIPAGIAPETIVSYLDTNYSGFGINEIAKTGYGYEVELTTGLDLRFDSTGSFLGLD